MSPLEEILQFVLSLQDEYGFLVDIKRLKICLSSVDDITDLEEVLYRLQALICRSEEQVSDFRALFGQRFLGEHVRELARISQYSGRSSKILRDEYATKLKAAESLQEKLERSQETENEIKRRKQDVSDELTALMEQKERIWQAFQTENGMRSYELSRNVDHGNTRLQRRWSRLAEALDGLDYGDAEIPVLDRFKVAEQIKTSGELIDFIDGILAQGNGLIQLEDIEKQFIETLKDSDPADDLYSFTYLSKLTRLISEYIELWKTALGPNKLREYRNLHELKDSLPEMIQEKRSEKTTLVSRLQDQWMETARISELLRQKTDEVQVLDDSIKRLESQNTLVKDASFNHRPIFTAENNRAVQTTEEMQEILSVSLRTMTAQQQAVILSYIRTNARIFRQTLRRKSAVPVRRQIDVRRTIRLAARTDGEPVRIRYKAPKKSHARVVCLVDISGSCRAAAELSLYFMAMMDDAFPGSCKKFAFVNHLVSVDKYFQNQSAAEGIQAIHSNVPSRGVYSNCGGTIHELREEYESLFHKDTTVIIFGDARNNRNETAADDLKFIADRARKVFWLNPDDEKKWGQGDSVIYQYQRVGAEVFHVSTAGELLSFLTEANTKV